jgi:disulfide bond formation protein DsbB
MQAIDIVRTLLGSRRALNALGFLLCASLMGFAYYAQFVLALEPCPLCIFQRVAMIALGLAFLAAALYEPKSWGARVNALTVFVAAGAGVAVAGRHVWLQHLPPELVPACGPGLDYLLDVLPAADVVRQVFTGSGECAKIDWTFLGLAMPTWVLLWFIALGVAGVWNNLRKLERA